MRRWWGAAVVAALSVTRAADAQRPFVSSVEAWGGYANGSPQWGILGETPGMRLALVGLRFAHALGGAPAAGALPSAEWTVDVIPVARLSPPLVSLRGTGVPCETAALCVLPPVTVAGDAFPPGSPMGFGVVPLGYVRRFRGGARLSPFVGAAGGALFFDARVPTTKASHFNFTAQAEAGVRIGSPADRGMTITYRFHHLSNAGTVRENPGVASHMILVGLHSLRRADATP